MSPSSGPSTGLLVGLGLVVAGLVVAITVVLLSGGDDSGDTETDQGDVAGGSDTTEPDTTSDDSGDGDDGGDVDPEIDESDIEQMDEDEIAETDPLGMNDTVDQLVEDFAGTIDEDDARCMLRASTLEVIELGRIGEEDIENWPEEDQVALLSAMFDCFDEPTTAMADVLAVGLAENPEYTETQAECVAAGYVDGAGLDEVYRLVAGLMDETMTDPEARDWFVEWLLSLPQAAQTDIANTEFDCL